jgi:hypothetical protein
VLPFSLLLFASRILISSPPMEGFDAGGVTGLNFGHLQSNHRKDIQKEGWRTPCSGGAVFKAKRS